MANSYPDWDVIPKRGVRVSVDFEDYLDTEVFDEKSHLIGSFECFWSNDDDETQLLGIKLNSSPERTRVVPLVLITPDERQSCIRVHASENHIAAAPSLDCDEEMNDKLEEKVYSHFSLTVPSEPHELHITRAK
jgi:hypothetical protein